MNRWTGLTIGMVSARLALYFALGLGGAAPLSGQAQSAEEKWAGREAMVVVEVAEIRSQGKVLQRLNQGAIVRVGSVRDGWLWIPDSRGYLQAKLVIPVEEGVAFYSEKLARDPTPQSYFQRGWLHKHLGDLPAAIADFSAALERKPDYLRALLARSQALERMTDNTAALADLDSALKLAGDRAVVLSARGLFHHRVGNPELAEADFSAALSDLDLRLADTKLRPSARASLVARKADLLSDRGWSLFKREQLDLALADLDAAVSLAPESWFFAGRRRSVWRKQGKYELVLGELNAACSKPEVHPATLNELAHLLASCPEDGCRDGKRAIELATRACGITGDRKPEYLDTLAMAHAEAGDFSRAVEVAGRALAMAAGAEQAEFADRLERYRQSIPWREQ